MNLCIICIQLKYLVSVQEGLTVKLRDTEKEQQALQDKLEKITNSLSAEKVCNLKSSNPSRACVCLQLLQSLTKAMWRLT